MEQTDDAWQYAEYARFLAGWGELWWGWLWVEAAVAGPIVRFQDGDLAFEAEDGAGHVGDAQVHASVVDQVAGREVVATVTDDVVAFEDFEDVIGGGALGIGDDFDVWVQRS